MNFKKQDWILNVAILFLAFCGLISLYSVNSDFFRQQLIWYVIGVAVFFVVSSLDWRPLMNYPKFIKSIYIFSVFLLVATYFLAPEIRGAKSWIIFGSFQFQASEFVKLALILILSFFWAKAHVRIAHIRNLLISFIYFIIPAFLILIQPDMGSMLILFGIWFGYLLVSGIKWRHLAVATVIFVILGIILWGNFLVDYQKKRVLGFFYPERDPLGINYNVIQSKIAIGSAGFFGKGFKQGTQAQLGFLPEAQTDFIFSAFTEEWGLVGAFLVIAAFLIFMIRIVKAGLTSENNFFKLVCLGAVILFMLHFLVNTGSVLGLLPVIGVPFPFLSYGGSNLLTNFMLIGIIQSIIIRSKF